jgi:predicted esterase
MINVLCLHGCNQTQEMFEGLMKNFVRLGEKQYNLKFFFTEAKYDHPNGGKTWYKRPLEVSQIGSIPYEDDLVRETLNDIDELIEENNIQVLLGFSQGANVVDTFLGYKGNKKIKCAVIMSGYALVDTNRENVDVPVLGVISEKDDVVPYKLNPTQYFVHNVIMHDKGHKLPTQNSIIRQICTFMQTCQFV